MLMLNLVWSLQTLDLQRQSVCSMKSPFSFCYSRGLRRSWNWCEVIFCLSGIRLCSTELSDVQIYADICITNQPVECRGGKTETRAEFPQERNRWRESQQLACCSGDFSSSAKRCHFLTHWNQTGKHKHFSVCWSFCRCVSLNQIRNIQMYDGGARTRIIPVPRLMTVLTRTSVPVVCPHHQVSTNTHSWILPDSVRP